MTSTVIFRVEIARRDRGRDLRHVAELHGEVRRHRVDVVGEVLPRAAHALDVRLPAELSLGADFFRDARDLRREGAERVDHRVDGVLELVNLAARVDGDLLREVAVGDRRRDLRDRAHLRGEISREAVDVVGQILPRARDAFDVGLPAELSLRADFFRDARDLRGERRELIDHDVDRVLQLEDLAARVDGDLLREVALRDGGRDLRDVAHLRGEVGGEAVDVVGQVLPRSADAFDVGLPAELSLVTDFFRDARDLGGERVELIDHRVDGRADAEKLAAHRAPVDLEDHLLRQVAARDGGDDARDLVGRRDEVGDQLVDRAHAVRPLALRRADRSALVHLAFLADDLADANELARHVLVHADDVVQQLAGAAQDAVLFVREADAEVARLHRLEDLDEALDLGAARGREAIPLVGRRRHCHSVAIRTSVPVRGPTCARAVLLRTSSARGPDASFLLPHGHMVRSGARACEWQVSPNFVGMLPFATADPGS